MKKKILNYNKHFIDYKDFRIVKRALYSKNLTQGSFVEKFERKLSNYTGSKYCLTTNSASTALFLCIKSIIIKNKKISKKCYISPNTYVATANAAILNGLTVDFIDIDKSTLNMCPVELERKLIKNINEKNQKTIVILTHFGGNPCHLRKFYGLSKKYNLEIIEDASHAMGSNYENIKIGNPKYSTFVVTSFHPVKTITTAEGGAIFTNSRADKVLIDQLRSNGIIKNNFFQKKYHNQIYPSLNFRMSDLNAALGISQLQKISNFLKKRNFIAKFYKKFIKNKNISFQTIQKKSLSSFHLFIIQINKFDYKAKINFMKRIKNQNIALHNMYIPIYFFDYYKEKIKKNICKNAENYYEASLCLPIYYDLKIEQIRNLIKELNEI